MSAVGIRAPIPAKVDDAATNAAIAEHRQSIASIVATGVADARIVADVVLADGVATPIAHGMGRAPRMVTVSPPRGASATGRIEEVRSTTYNRAIYLVLKATGWGASITVDVEVR